LREQETRVTNTNDDLIKTKKEIEEYTQSLEKEEKVYEKMTDSLKGETQEFQVKIEKQQQELAPWIEKKNKIKSIIEIAQSEYDILFKKSNANQDALKLNLSQQKTISDSLKQKV